MPLSRAVARTFPYGATFFASEEDISGQVHVRIPTEIALFGAVFMTIVHQRKAAKEVQVSHPRASPSQD